MILGTAATLCPPWRVLVDARFASGKMVAASKRRGIDPPAAVAPIQPHRTLP